MKIKLILLFAFLQGLTVNSQITEYYSYNTQWGGVRHFIKTNDNGLAILSYVNGPVVLRTDSNGIIIWQKQINYADSEFAYEIAQTSDNGFVIMAGQSPGVILAIKLSANGTILWAKSLLNGYYDMTVAATTGNAVMFTSGNGCSGSNHVYKVDSLGNIEWQKWYTVLSATWSVQARKIIVDNNGNSIVCGNVYPDSSKYNGGYIMSVGPNGALNWFHEYDLGYNTTMNNVIQTSTGNYVVIGEKFVTDTNCFVYLLATDSMGIPLWSKTYETTHQWTQLEGITEMPDKSLLLSGNTFYPFPVHQQGLLFRTDSVGNLLWSLSEGNYNFNELGSDYFHDVVAHHDDWFYMSGDYQDGITMSHLNDSVGLCSPTTEPLNVTLNSVLVNSPLITVFDDSYSFQTISTAGINPNWSKIPICPPDTSSQGLNLIEQNTQQVDLFPNPCTDYFRINHNFGNEPFSVLLVDIFGRIIQDYSDSMGQVNFYLPNIESGIYYLLIHYDGKSYSKKLVVE